MLIWNRWQESGRARGEGGRTDRDSTSHFMYICVWQSVQKTQFNVLIISASQIVYFRIKSKLSYMVWIVRTCRVLLVGFSSMMMTDVSLFFLLSWVSEPILWHWFWSAIKFNSKVSLKWFGALSQHGKMVTY